MLHKEEDMIATTEKKLTADSKPTNSKLPQLHMPLPGPKAKRIAAQDAKFVSPSYTRDYPLVAKRGTGAMVEDVDGNVFLDFAAGIAVCATGHCHPDVVAAVQKQAAELLHMSGTDFYYEGMPKLASKLSAIAPGKETKRVYFGNSGAEAIEAAIKLAKYHTGRDKIIAFEGAFHGRTMGALSLTSSKYTQRKGFGTLLSGVFHMPYPDSYRGMYGKGPETVTQDCLWYLEHELFKRRVDPEEVAGKFVEPIQGEGGDMPAPKEFLQGLQAICRKYGIMLVADEVQSGMGRTGKWWASDHAGIEPDIITSAKGIASGMPLSAVIARESVMNWKPGAHASTFGGNPVCIAAALATIELLESKYIANAARVGDYIMKRTADWTQKFKHVGNVRGRVLMIGVVLVKDQKTKEKASERRNRIIDAGYHKGLLILGSGENTVRFCPPLVIDEEQAEFAVKTLEELLSKEEAK